MSLPYGFYQYGWGRHPAAIKPNRDVYYRDWMPPLRSVRLAKGILWSKGFGLFDQHDRDIVPDLVNQPAGLADQAIFGLCEVNLPLALGQARMSSSS